MPTLDLHIDAGDLGQLTELPTQILAAVATARQALDGADTAATGNALGDLGTLPGRFGDLPDLGSALGGLTGLGDLLPAGLPASAAGAVEALGHITGMLAPLARLVDGDPAQLVAAAVDRLGGLTATVAQQSADAAGVAGELRQFFTLLASLEGWTSHPPSADEVAALVAKALIGADLDLLAAPVAALERTLGALERVLPDDDLTHGTLASAASRRRGRASRPASPHPTSTGARSSSTCRPRGGSRPSSWRSVTDCSPSPSPPSATWTSAGWTPSRRRCAPCRSSPRCA